MWHWKLCHIGFDRVQNLFRIPQQDANELFPSATPRTRQEGSHNAPVGAWPVQTSSPEPILRARNEGVTSEKVRMGLKCLACELSKAKCRQPNNDKSICQQEMPITHLYQDSYQTPVAVKTAVNAIMVALSW